MMRPEEDDQHEALHIKVEDDVQLILTAMFDDPICRANVLLKLFYAEFMALDEADDVAELAQDLFDIIGDRAMKDLALFNTAGSA